MKKISVIYKNRDNQEAISHLSSNLERIFGDYIFIENYYLNELPANFTIIADAYLLADDSNIYSSKNHIPNFNHVVLMNRSISKSNLKEVLELPPGADVLLVNDTYENAVKTIHGLYAIDIGHVNFVPYDPCDINNLKYRNLKICVTPNEPDLVPPHIERIVNIGYREISFDTIANLMKTLNLDFDFTNRNLIRHLRSIEEPRSGFHDNYLSNCLKSQVLSNVMNKSQSAILIVNEDYRLIYSNEKANSLFRLESIEAAYLKEVLDNVFFDQLKKDLPPKTLDYKGECVFLEKNAIMLVDEVIGYCIYVQREKDLAEVQLLAKKKQAQKGLCARYTFSDIIHESEAMEKTISLAKAAAMSGHTVLITGESGVGKELIAQSLHNFSKRSAAPFVAVNCAALPESLLESELFGYEAGSFTGANKEGKMGLFEQANGGTIFLDEIGDTSPHLQSRLLRVLQEHQVARVGSDRIIDVDIWIIAATNKELRDEVAGGKFRKDLFYRLNVFNITVEPLRNRKADILPLMSHFLGAKYKELAKKDATQLLLHDWPGNVRELESAAIHFSALSALPSYLYDISPQPSFAEAGEGSGRIPNPTNPGGIRLEILKIIARNTQAYHGMGRLQLNQALKATGIQIGDKNLREILKELSEKQLIEIGKGREGTRITKAGLKEIKSRGRS